MQVALSLNNLAALLRQMDRKAQAEEMYRKALAIREDALGLDHPQVQSRSLDLASPCLGCPQIGNAHWEERGHGAWLDTAAVFHISADMQFAPMH